MSLVKDIRYVTSLATMVDCHQPNEAAAKLILSSMELKLRAIIQESIKYAMLFDKEKVGVDEIETAIQDLHFEENNSAQPFESFKSSEEAEPSEGESKAGGDTVEQPFFSNKVLDIDSKIASLSKVALPPVPEISFDWVQIDNKIPFTPSNAQIKSLRQNKVQIVENSLLQQKLRKKLVHGISIKEQQGPSLSLEFDDFLGAYFSIMAEQMALIDSGRAKLGSFRFLNRNQGLNSSKYDREIPQHPNNHAFHPQEYRREPQHRGLQRSLEEEHVRDGDGCPLQQPFTHPDPPQTLHNPDVGNFHHFHEAVFK